MNEFYTVKENVEAEITEKKSRFIANVFYVKTKEEAEMCLEKVRKKYYDAKHNCYAYSIELEEGTYQKCSDDGEPSGTAGEPILNIIKQIRLNNILIVVTRYFGGILLGTGGLCRAYSEAATKVINEENIIHMQKGLQIQITLKYEDNGVFKNYCKKNNIKIINSIYETEIKYILELNEEEYNNLEQDIKAKKILKSTNKTNIIEICRKYIEK